MPTILRIKGYRIGFFSADGDEPPHVHVDKGNGKFRPILGWRLAARERRRFFAA